MASVLCLSLLIILTVQHTLLLPHPTTHSECIHPDSDNSCGYGLPALHIKAKVKTDIVATKAYRELVKDIMDRTYVSNSNGSKKYFKDTKNNQFSADIIEGGEITEAFVIACAQFAFHESGHSKGRISVIDGIQ